MSFTNKYKNDIFISYVHIDNQPLPGINEGWVSTFVKGLTLRLCQILGINNDSLTCFDSGGSCNNIIAEQPISIFKESALFLIISSPGYLASDWYNENTFPFINFIKNNQELKFRVFIIEYNEILAENRPEEYNFFHYYKFWVKDNPEDPPHILGLPKPNPDDIRYFDKLNDIAYDMGKELCRIKKVTDKRNKNTQKNYKECNIKKGILAGKGNIIRTIINQKREMDDFDVFLCHNSEDKQMVKAIGEKLKENGVLPWLDEWELRPGEPWQRTLENQIRKIKSAAVFIGKDGIGPWQQQELDAFLRKFVSRNCAVIPVLLQYAPQAPELPLFLEGLHYVDFRKQQPDPFSQLYWGITGQKLSEIRPYAFLAEVTDELEPIRDNVKRFLDQHGIVILPYQLYSRDYPEFIGALNQDLDKCDIFIQLLSAVAGKKPQNQERTYVQLQYDQAMKKDIPIMQWRDPGLDISTVDNSGQKMILTLNTVMAMGLEEFKREIIKKLQKKQSEIKSPIHAFVFVNMETNDRTIAENMCTLLEKYGIEYALPVRDGKPSEIREDLEQNLLDCDAVIIIYGTITVTWVREQLRQCRKILAKREKPLKALAVYEGPPTSKIPLDLKLKNMDVLDCRKGLEITEIERFLNSVNT